MAPSPADAPPQSAPGRTLPWVIATAVLALALVGGAVAVIVTWPSGSHSQVTASKHASAPTSGAVSIPSSSTPAGPQGDTVLACSSPPGNPTVGATETVTASLGKISATVTGTVGPTGFNPMLRNPFIAIRSGTNTLVSAPLHAPAQASGVELLGLSPSGGPLCVVRFPHQTAPTILLGLFTGGAHCCFVVRAWPVTNGAMPSDENTGNGGARAAQSVAGAEVVTTDDAFYYSFASYAASGAPVVVQTFAGRQFVDVTAQHLDLVQADAEQWINQFYGSAVPGNTSLDGLGSLAAWAGDECRLGVPGEPWATLADLQSKGELTGPTGWPAGQAFVDQLHSFLSRHGYCTKG